MAICDICGSWGGLLSGMVEDGHHARCPKHPENMAVKIERLQADNAKLRDDCKEATESLLDAEMLMFTADGWIEENPSLTELAKSAKERIEYLRKLHNEQLEDCMRLSIENAELREAIIVADGDLYDALWQHMFRLLHEEASLATQRDRLRQDVRKLRGLLRAANRGAERNAACWRSACRSEKLAIQEANKFHGENIALRIENARLRAERQGAADSEVSSQGLLIDSEPFTGRKMLTKEKLSEMFSTLKVLSDDDNHYISSVAIIGLELADEIKRLREDNETLRDALHNVVFDNFRVRQQQDADIARLRADLLAAAERIAAQAELLSKRAESPLTVEQARQQKRCRICGGPEEMQMTYNYGDEYAHTRCLAESGKSS